MENNIHLVRNFLCKYHVSSKDKSEMKGTQKPWKCARDVDM